MRQVAFLLVCGILSWAAWAETKVIEVSGTPLSKLVFSGDGSLLAVGSKNKEVVVYDTSSWSEVSRFQAHDAIVHDLAFSPDRNLLATASSDKSIRIHDRQGKLVHRIAALDGQWGLSVAFSPDGKRLAAAFGDTKVRLYDTSNWKQLWESPQFSGSVIALSFQPGGGKLAALESATNGRALLLDSSTGKVAASNGDLRGNPQALAFSQDGKWLAASSSQPRLVLMAADKASRVHDFESSLLSLGFSPDGGRILGLASDGFLRVFDTASKTRLYRGNPSAQQMMRCELGAVDPAGKWIVMAGDLSGRAKFGLVVIPVEELKP